jgi:hypothetical protein
MNMPKNTAHHPNPKNNSYLVRLSADFEKVYGKLEKVIKPDYQMFNSSRYKKGTLSIN